MNGVALGHEVVDNQHLVIGLQPILSHQQGNLLFVGVGKDFALIQATLDIVAFCLLGKHHGHAVALGAYSGKGNATGLGGQHQSNVADVKILGKFVCDLAHKGGVYPVVQKTIHLDDISRKHPAFLANPILQQLHVSVPPRKHYIMYHFA